MVPTGLDKAQESAGQFANPVLLATVDRLRRDQFTAYAERYGPREDEFGCVLSSHALEVGRRTGRMNRPRWIIGDEQRNFKPDGRRLKAWIGFGEPPVVIVDPKADVRSCEIIENRPKLLISIQKDTLCKTRPRVAFSQLHQW